MSELLDREGSIPLYVQLTNILRDKIEHREWAPNQKIPSENDLNRIYGVSRMTARQVLSQLVNDGLLFRVQGKGTFVAPLKIGTRSPAYKGFREQLEQMGYETTTTLVSTDLVVGEGLISRNLGLQPGEKVYVLQRLRHIDGEPISLHVSYVPESLAPGLDRYDIVKQQLCVVLEENFNLRMRHVTETLESTSASALEAKLLGVSRRAPLLLLQQFSDDSGVRFEHSKIVFRGDKIRLEFEYDL
ncbi:MAG: GntR family transcriptional regulator [Dermatophilaceae bacterium]